MFTSTAVVAHAPLENQQPAVGTPLDIERALAAKLDMRQPANGKQFSLCPDTGEVEDAQRAAHKQQQQQQQHHHQQEEEEDEELGDHLTETDNFVDAKLLASLALDHLDLKLEDPGATDLLEVVKSEAAPNGVTIATDGSGGGASPAEHFEASLAGIGDIVTTVGAVKREPGGAADEEMFGAKVRRVMVGDAAIQQLLTAAGQAGQTGPDGRLSFTVDPRLLAATQQQLIMQQPQQLQTQQLQPQQLQGLQQHQIVQIQQQQQQQQQLTVQAQNQPRFLLAWKAENNELVPVCIPIQGGASKFQLGGDAGAACSLPAELAGAVQAGGGTQIIQLPALGQGGALQLPGGAFQGLTQSLQLPTSGLLQGQNTLLQLPAGGAMAAGGTEFPPGATILQIPAAHLASAAAAAQTAAGQELLVGTEAAEVVKESNSEPDVDTDAADEKALPCDDVSSSSMAPDDPSGSAQLAGVPGEVEAAAEAEEELEAEEERDPESWRLRHAVTILEKSQINFLRDARRSFKCYQCGGLIKPPALEVEVDLAPYGIRPVLCTDCGKFHLNKRNVNVRVTTDEGCEQLHRFMSA